MLDLDCDSRVIHVLGFLLLLVLRLVVIHCVYDVAVNIGLNGPTCGCSEFDPLEGSIMGLGLVVNSNFDARAGDGAEDLVSERLDDRLGLIEVVCIGNDGEWKGNLGMGVVLAIFHLFLVSLRKHKRL